ncbi:hypothetical protein B9G53_18830 [Pseudanabaena sp. SR411]|uniref:YdcF family protein n=1 Tax=Pseudanabaena sp. SR411 TaxID=1980935 RepID=UPI000B98589F|nr:YdcF family protein [Pseudanabaena sp. SR411]OYQ63084.1 hypothetical protein B9G53_18830 [Pseudanabaena sp. SR411]
MLESLIFFALLWVLWLVSSRQQKRRVILPVAIIGVIYLFLTSPIGVDLANHGLTFALPPDTGEKADAIIILGRGESLRSHRVEVASKLWKAQRAPQIFVSGMLDAEESISQLQNWGISKIYLSGERCSQTTEENAQFTTAVLHPQGIQKILLLTDAPHMLRSQILFQSFGFKVIAHSIPLPTNWSTNDRLGTVIREYVGLIIYRWQGRLRQRTQDEIDHPNVEVTDRLKAWHCHVSGEKN